MSGGKWSEHELEKRQQAMFDVVLDQVLPTMDPARAGEGSETTAERKGDGIHYCAECGAGPLTDGVIRIDCPNGH